MAWPTDPGLGLGVTAGLEPAVGRQLAERCADLGYCSLWSNDEPHAPGLETLGHFAVGAPDVDLGVGVLPLDRHPPAQIAAAVDRLGLDPARLLLGIGSGQLRPQLQPVEEAIADLRGLLPAVRIVVGTMRPALSRLGGRLGDGVLLNWMLPAPAAEASEWVADGAADAGRPPPVTALYIRTAVGPGAMARLQHEEGRYRGFDPAHFAAMDVPLGAVGIAASARSEVVTALAAYRRAVDLSIVRVLADNDLAALIAVAEAAAP